MFYFVSHSRNVSACWSVYSVGLGGKCYIQHLFRRNLETFLKILWKKNWIHSSDDAISHFRTEVHLGMQTPDSVRSH